MEDGPKLDEHALLEELRASEARFRAICEAAPLGIYVSEVGKGVVYVNPAMQRILGRAPQELLGTGWQQCLHPDDRARALAERSQNYRAASPMRVTARYVRGDGSVVWAHTHAAPIREGDQLLGYVGMIEDVSEQKALQAQLVMAGRLASVGTLAAGVAHEVNTPLAVMLGNLGWTRTQLATAIEAIERVPSAAQVADILRALEGPLAEASEAAQRVGAIMKELTVFSRPAEEEQGSADLERVLASAARMASHALRHRARLIHDYEGELPWVNGSEARLGQVFVNLLINAAHAIPEGGPDAHEVRLRVRAAQPGTVAVEVIDSGEGIEASVLERIFDPFFTTKPHSLGTGLGLPICHRIVTGVGGRIEVESEPGRGSVFRVLLPTTEPGTRASTLPAEPSAVAPRRRGRVLMIDDDHSLLATMARLLADDHEVHTTSSACSALARLQAGERFDAVLCDLMMPEMDGMAFHAALAQALPALADRVIFVTGGAVTQSARDFLERIPNARLAKPFVAGELLALLASRVAEG